MNENDSQQPVGTCGVAHPEGTVACNLGPGHPGDHQHTAGDLVGVAWAACRGDGSPGPLTDPLPDDDTPRVVNVFQLADRVAHLERWRDAYTDPGLGDRLLELERWRDEQTADVSEPTDEPTEAGEAGALRFAGSIRAPGWLAGERADRADAMLTAAETVKATGGKAEIAGVRIEACDDRGQTGTTKQLDRARAELETTLADLEAERRWRAHFAADRNQARAERDQVRRQRDEALDQRNRARRELAVALAGAESAEKDTGVGVIRGTLTLAGDENELEDRVRDVPDVDERLQWMLRVLADDFGQLGVVRTAAAMWPQAAEAYRMNPSDR